LPTVDLAEPGEEPFDDLTAQVCCKADLIGIFAHDLDGDQRGLSDLLAGAPAISEEPLDEWKDTPRGPQQRATAVAILDARWMQFKNEATRPSLSACAR
jgi:hypothetical protein